MSLFFFSSRRRHTRLQGDWSSDVCSSDLDEVEPALPAGAAGHGEVQAGDRAGGALELALTGLEGGFEPAFQRVRRRADLLFGGRVELGQAPENLGERAGLASQDLGLEIRKPALVRLRNFLQTLPQLGEGCQEVAHDQSACLATSASCSNATGSRTARSARTLRLISTPGMDRSLRHQQPLEASFVGVRHERGLAQVTLPLRVLLGQDVALVRVVPA